jgi:hypothetical protein
MSKVSLTIVKYPAKYAIFGLLAMAMHHISLLFNRKISFYKLMGTGKNGTFDKHPDWQQWAVLTVLHSNIDLDRFKEMPSDKAFIQHVYGRFIAAWYRWFCCNTTTLLMEAIEGHGLWDKKKVFGNLSPKSDYEGPIAVITRATIRLNKLKYFWENVAPVAIHMATAAGFRFSIGVGEVPWIKQATFSIWDSKADMKAFAYGMKEHAAVIQKTRKEDWYSEDMFTRFKIIQVLGALKMTGAPATILAPKASAF